jgi:hypothetical protein
MTRGDVLVWLSLAWFVAVDPGFITRFDGCLNCKFTGDLKQLFGA